MKTQGTAFRVLVAYLIILAFIAFWPSPVDRPIDGQLSWILAFLHRHGASSWLNYSFVESAANVLLFLPFGMLTALVQPAKRWWVAIPVGFLVSCCIELGQLFFLSARVASVADVLVNTTGAALGAMGAVALRSWRDRKSAAATERHN